MDSTSHQGARFDAKHRKSKVSMSVSDAVASNEAEWFPHHVYIDLYEKNRLIGTIDLFPAIYPVDRYAY
jgi:hypothetical protein